MPLRWRMHTNFPFSRVFVLGIILSLLGLASMIISIIAFVIQSWGHYVGTGMWGGAVILASGLTAVFVSQMKSLTSVRTFSVLSVISVITSSIVFILSAGGLTLNSGFYSHADSADYNKRTSNLIHASLLVISVLCLIGNILAVVVCCKYLIFAHHDKPKCHLRNRNIPFGTVRTHTTFRDGAPNSSSTRSTNSRTPLNVTSHTSRRHSDHVDFNRVQNENRRCHKHLVPDQPHSNSRRHRHGNLIPRNNNNTSLLPASGLRHDSDRRNESSRIISQGIEIRGNNKERGRLNIVPLRHASNRSFSQVHIQTRFSRNLVTTSPNVCLPTEFNEEELPPYNAVTESSTNALTGAHSDSGDESDTENSSIIEVACALGELTRGDAPVVEVVNNQTDETNCTKENQNQPAINLISFHELQSNTSALNVPNCEHGLERYNHSANPSTSKEENIGKEANGEAGHIMIRKDFRRPNKLELRYINTQPSSKIGLACQSSVPIKNAVATKESLQSASKNASRLATTVQENLYENGPCYENTKCANKSKENTSMNHLSKSSSSDIKKTPLHLTSAPRGDKGTNIKISASTIKALVENITCPVSSKSLDTSQSSVGCAISAFRPIEAAASSLSNAASSSTAERHLPHSNINNCSPYDNVLVNSSPHVYANAHSSERNHDTSSSPTSKYIEQGAKPKAVKNKGEFSQFNSNTNMPWTNIKQPLSYNHSESASGESEKKLPSKMIPFTDSKQTVSGSSVTKEESSVTNMSSGLPLSHAPANSMSSSLPHCSSSVFASKSLAMPVSPIGAGNQAILETPAKINNNEIFEPADLPQQIITSSVDLPINVPGSSVSEASTQVNSVSTSRVLSRRMGNNQSLLQSRREELLNSQLFHRSRDRTTRPSSMPVSSGFSGICHGISGLLTDRQLNNRSKEVPLTNHPRQQPQSLSQRQHHLLLHYPLQPQQPRLGVQLHHRRQQQNQLQQNIESQQQYQQQQIQQQQLHQQPRLSPPQQNQQRRNGRPLFSVLL